MAPPMILFTYKSHMAPHGSSTSIKGPGDEFYCGPFYPAGKIILALSLLIFGNIEYPGIKKSLI